MQNQLTDDQQKAVMLITVKLAQLGLHVSFVHPVTVGPLITTYRFVPKNSTKVSQIESCSDDLAVALATGDVLVRKLTGEAVIGISVPNANRCLPLWRVTLTQPVDMLVPLNLGIDAEGRLFREDLVMLPHLLIAGSTMGGKSTEVNAVLAALMYWRQPDQVQFCLSDTKRVDYTHLEYPCNGFMWAPTAESMYTTWELMDHLIDEIERRLTLLNAARCPNVAEHNTRHPQRKLPYIVLVIDELADVLGGEKRGEAKIASAKLGKIVQKSRATGIHVIACTQRPSVNIVGGVIKANFPARLTFRLPSGDDSRTVIGSYGAEHLLARGDMLYVSPNRPGVTRLHASHVDMTDVEACLRACAYR